MEVKWWMQPLCCLYVTRSTLSWSRRTFLVRRRWYLPISWTGGQFSAQPTPRLVLLWSWWESVSSCDCYGWIRNPTTKIEMRKCGTWFPQEHYDLDLFAQSPDYSDLNYKVGPISAVSKNNAHKFELCKWRSLLVFDCFFYCLSCKDFKEAMSLN